MITSPLYQWLVLTRLPPIPFLTDQMPRANKIIPVFKVTRPYLNLLVKHRIFFRFSGKKVSFYAFWKAIWPFKMHKMILYSRKNNQKKYVCLLYLKFSDPLPETHLFFYFALPLSFWWLIFPSIYLHSSLLSLNVCMQLKINTNKKGSWGGGGGGGGTVPDFQRKPVAVRVFFKRRGQDHLSPTL